VTHRCIVQLLVCLLSPLIHAAELVGLSSVDGRAAVAVRPRHLGQLRHPGSFLLTDPDPWSFARAADATLCDSWKCLYRATRPSRRATAHRLPDRPTASVYKLTYWFVRLLSVGLICLPYLQHDAHSRTPLSAAGPTVVSV